ncbi:MAG TPA: hypothetical protein VLB80_05140 [Candidatus Babeliales bacterium]|nr:hypothetical protein [Candidatus Babeliales bacterium]
MIIRCSNFFVDEFLWMLTWGWYQLTLGLIFTWFIFILMGRMRLLSAFVLTISSYAFAITAYFGLVFCFIINFFQWEFVSGGIPNVYSPFYASLIFAVILSVMQYFFYCIIGYWKIFFASQFFILSLVSNILAALCSSYFIKLTF